MKSCVLIYNPKSGKQTIISKLSKIRKRLKAEGYVCTIRKTRYPQHAIKIAKEISRKDIDLLVIAGGDGTFNECLNGLMAHNQIPPIGYLPVGTSCDIAHTLGISTNVDKALDLIFSGKKVFMDIVKSNHGYFTYISAIGSYVNISYQTPKRLKKLLGYPAYLIAGIKAFFTVPKMKLNIKTPNYSKSGKFTLVLVTNSQKVARLTMINRPILDDGKIDLITFTYVPLLNNFMYAFKFLFNPKKMMGLRKIQTDRGEISMQQPYQWSQDGEPHGQGSLTFEVIPKKLPIIINPKRTKYFTNQD